MRPSTDFRNREGDFFPANKLKVRCGAYDLIPENSEHFDYQERNLDTYSIHPFYSGPKSLKNNIAVIHTKKRFIQTPNVNRICLPQTDVGFRYVKLLVQQSLLDCNHLNSAEFCFCFAQSGY